MPTSTPRARVDIVMTTAKGLVLWPFTVKVCGISLYISPVRIQALGGEESHGNQCLQLIQVTRVVHDDNIAVEVADSRASSGLSPKRWPAPEADLKSPIMATCSEST
jgi:hypothetical protein